MAETGSGSKGNGILSPLVHVHLGSSTDPAVRRRSIAPRPRDVAVTHVEHVPVVRVAGVRGDPSAPAGPVLDVNIEMNCSRGAKAEIPGSAPPMAAIAISANFMSSRRVTTPVSHYKGFAVVATANAMMFREALPLASSGGAGMFIRAARCAFAQLPRRCQTYIAALRRASTFRRLRERRYFSANSATWKATISITIGGAIEAGAVLANVMKRSAQGPLLDQA